MRPLVKVGEKDWENYTGKGFTSPREVVRHFLNLGASWVAVVMEGESYLLADQEEEYQINGVSDEILNAPNTEPAFWAGFLTAWLDGGDLKKCGRAGQRIAEFQLNHSGPLPDRIDRKEAIIG